MEYLFIDDELHLERIKPTHAAIIFETIDRDRNYLRHWLPFVDHTQAVSDTRHYIRLLLQKRKSLTDDVYTIWYRGEFAGLAGYKESDEINHKTEIGYWLAEKMQGKGIMTRTVKKMVDFAFRNLNRNRIQIKVAIGNQKSAAIPLRLGFCFEGIERCGEFHSPGYHDLQVFSFLKNEWVSTILNPDGTK